MGFASSRRRRRRIWAWVRRLTWAAQSYGRGEGDGELAAEVGARVEVGASSQEERWSARQRAVQLTESRAAELDWLNEAQACGGAWARAWTRIWATRAARVSCGARGVATRA